jgi:heptaprenyl diphosphate synthase
MLVATNPISFIYSIVSGTVSVIVMSLCSKYLNKYFSLIGISVIGAMTHNASQITVAAVMFSTFNIYYYLPVMSLISTFTGCFVGYVSIFMSDNLKKTLLNIRKEV